MSQKYIDLMDEVNVLEGEQASIRRRKQRKQSELDDMRKQLIAKAGKHGAIFTTDNPIIVVQADKNGVVVRTLENG